MKIPASTYRLQITPGAQLGQAAETLDYLHSLGVDWVYLSPILQAGDGSEHGYDVADPSVIDPARGGEEGLRQLAQKAHEHGMGVLVDIVPNHQGVAVPAHNPWWWSVLREGQASPYARAFDIDWEAGGGKVLLPVLGNEDDLGALKIEGGELRYYDQSFPLAEGSWAEGDDPRAVHERQHYRLMDWRRGDRELNYRRFFTIATLAGVRVEDRAVLEESHAEILRWVREGLVDGLRIDHPDGLRDPGDYLRDLQQLSGGVYTVVEKILEPGESLPQDWATQGTTGYDALGEIDRLLTDPAGEAPLTRLDTQLRGGQALDWHDLIHTTKRAVTDTTLHAEVQRLARSAEQEGLALSHAVAVDALSEVLACFGVYRSYLPQGRDYLAAALAEAARRRPDLSAALEQLEPLLGLNAQSPEDLSETARRFQQTSGMVMAKGVEDSAFYRYTRLTSLTEVGGDPSQFALTPQEAHAAFARRGREWPHGLTALSTHDTKRSEGVRARIQVLAEMPQEWAELVQAVEQDLRGSDTDLQDGPLLNLVLQALVGAWPVSAERAGEYALKAAREAGLQTSWLDNNAEFEARLGRLVERLVQGDQQQRLADFAGRTEQAGYSNALAQKLIQLTMPGVPDVYQGSEVWSPALVDPDNRRPVNYAELAGRLQALDQADPGTDGCRPPVDSRGDAKLLLTSRALRLRRDQPELFGDYQPLWAQGERTQHAFAFSRGGVVAVATRLPLGLERADGWGDTALTLPQGDWEEILTRQPFSGTVRLADLLAHYPVALLRRR
ncbi:malto-oligosyltrehalose synthase [Deinococcus sp. Marseille-Q6407]|uniref:malto-oligosyltrehalose synthase n=1 Tax=Deinococcus sp. Marseille-Q6407 TaxID=2969223 RepID=UPI0021C16367|nr:malto-oligosyltrehalose synthase [Deinococcus sp. Marseille-Q6407]